jgi:mono/diheme cytochrome c family protein
MPNRCREMSWTGFRETSSNCPIRKYDSYQGMPSGMPQALSAGIAFRRWISGVGYALALLALTLPFPAQAQKPATPDLPAGTMQAKATTSCLECHEARIILQQRLSKPAWTKEVDKMVKWGAVVDAADRDALIDYLSTNFSPDKPPYNPQRATTGKSGSGKSSQ